jgi:hypothetical protein
MPMPDRYGSQDALTSPGERGMGETLWTAFRPVLYLILDGLCRVAAMTTVFPSERGWPASGGSRERTRVP